MLYYIIILFIYFYFYFIFSLLSPFSSSTYHLSTLTYLHTSHVQRLPISTLHHFYFILFLLPHSQPVAHILLLSSIFIFSFPNSHTRRPLDFFPSPFFFSFFFFHTLPHAPSFFPSFYVFLFPVKPISISPTG